MRLGKTLLIGLSMMWMLCACKRPDDGISNTNNNGTKDVFLQTTIRVVGDSRTAAEGTLPSNEEETRIRNVRIYFLDIPQNDEDGDQYDATDYYGQPADLNQAYRLITSIDLDVSDAERTGDTYKFNIHEMTELKVSKTYYVLAIANAPFNLMPTSLKGLKEETTDKFTYSGSELGTPNDTQDYFVMSSVGLTKITIASSNIFSTTPFNLTLNVQRICAKVALKISDLYKIYTDIPKENVNFPRDKMELVQARFSEGRKDTVEILEARMVNMYDIPTYWFPRTLKNASALSVFFPKVNDITPTSEANAGAQLSDPYTFERSWKLESADFQENSNYRDNYARSYNSFRTDRYLWDKASAKVRRVSPDSSSVVDAKIDGDYVMMGYVAENNCSYQPETYWFKHAAPAILIKARYKPGLLWEERTGRPNSIYGVGMKTNTFYGYHGRSYATVQAAKEANPEEGDRVEAEYDTYTDGIVYYLAWILTAQERQTPDEAVLQHIGANEVAVVRNNYYRIRLGNITFIGTDKPSSQIPRYNTFPMDIVQWKPISNDMYFE